MKKGAFKRLRQSNRKKQKEIITIVLLSLILLPSPLFAATQTAEVLSAPDLTLNPSDISFAPENPVVGQPVNITAIIHNIGGYTAKNVTVDFHIDSTSVIKKEIDKIHPDSPKSVSINFIFLYPGSHNVTVKIDANNTIIEQDETNNQATKFVDVAEIPPTKPTPPTPVHPGGRPTPTPTPSPGERTPLIISNVTVTLGHPGIISWDTNEESDSLVKCGLESGKYTIKEYNTTYTRSHAILLKELKENSTYYFVVNSTSPEGKSAESDEYAFFSPAPPKPPKEGIKIKSIFPIDYYIITPWWFLLLVIIALSALSITNLRIIRRKREERPMEREITAKPSRREEALSKLKKRFERGEISVDEYISKRGDIIHGKRE